MGRSANHQMLRMRGHSPAGDEDDKPRDEVAFWIAVAVATEPDPDQTSRPPNYSHSCVLPIVVSPLLSPAMFGEGVEAAPNSNDRAIIEFLRAPAIPDPYLADHEDNGKYNTVGDEGPSHDEVCCTLSEMVRLAKAQGGNAPKYHLSPRKYGHRLPNKGMARPNQLSDFSIDSSLPMTLQV